MFSRLPLLKDRLKQIGLALFRLILLLLLPIGQCMAQDVTLKTDLIGMKRRHVQIIMKPFSFTQYEKDHVTYIIRPDILQTINFNSDTCSSFFFSMDTKVANSFEEILIELKGNSSTSLYSVNIEEKKTIFNFEKSHVIYVDEKIVIENKKIKGNKRIANNKIESKRKEKIRRVSDLEADERYFKIQKPSISDSSGVFVFGWKVN